jgi:hypothetical protein
MDIKKHTYVRKLLLACLIVLMIVTTSCKQKPSRPPLSADEVKTLAAAFDKITSAHIDAWNKHDTNLMRQLYADDITYYETGNTPNYNGIDSLMNINAEVLTANPNFGVQQTGTFIGRAQGFTITNWNLDTELTELTGQNPESTYEWYTLRDGKISVWWFFYDSKYYAAQGSSLDSSPLLSYETAWSSGNAKTVASLYDPKVVRTDSLFGYDQQGSFAVKAFATNFFTWYPGMRLELLQSFKLFDSNPVMAGGVYAIHVSDKAGKPCDVRAIILLEIPQDKITKEWVFYNADSLIACG